MEKKRKYLAVIFAIFVLVLLIWGIVAHWAKISMIFSFIFYGMVIAYLLVPVSRWMEKFMPRSTAVILLFLIIIAALGLLFMLFIPQLIRQMTSMIEKLPYFTLWIKKIIAKFQTSLEEMGLPYGVQLTLYELVEGIEKKLLLHFKKGLDGFVDGIGRLAGYLTVPVLSFYFIKDREYFKKVVIGFIPSKVRGNIIQVASQVNEVLNQFIRGQLLIALVVGILNTIGFLIIRIPYALVLGLLAGFFEIVPYFGPFLGAVPAVIIAASNSPSKLIWTIVITIIVQQLEGNLFTPKIMGAHVGLHPVYIIIVLWLGGFFFGVLGILFAVPATLILKIILKNIYISIVSSPWSSER